MWKISYNVISHIFEQLSTSNLKAQISPDKPLFVFRHLSVLTIHRNACRPASDPHAGRSLCIVYFYYLLTGLKKRHVRRCWTALWVILYSHLKSDDTKFKKKFMCNSFPATAKAVVSLYVILCVCQCDALPA